MDIPDDTLREHAYLVSRGVRPLALAGHCPADALTMLRVATRLEALAPSQAIPFVIDRGDGTADYGFASARWALDLYRWVSKERGAIPEPHQHRIVGMLLGYGSEAIRAFEEHGAGRLFDAATASLAPASR